MARCSLMLAALVLSGGLLFAQDAGIAGTWVAEAMAGAGGAEQKSPLKLVIAMDEAEATGTLTNPLGEFALLGGKVDGKTVAFSVDMNGTRVAYDGLLTDEGLDIIATFAGRDRSDHFVARRAEE